MLQKSRDAAARLSRALLKNSNHTVMVESHALTGCFVNGAHGLDIRPHRLFLPILEYNNDIHLITDVFELQLLVFYQA